MEFNEDGTKLLAVTEKRMGYLGTIVVLDINVDVDAEQNDEKALVITCEESKATVAAWSFLSKYILAGHEDGTVSQYDAKVRTEWPYTEGEPLQELPSCCAPSSLVTHIYIYL